MRKSLCLRHCSVLAAGGWRIQEVAPNRVGQVGRAREGAIPAGPGLEVISRRGKV